MCTAEEVKKIVKEEVANSEKRLESYIDDMFYDRHRKNLETFSNLMDDIQTRLKELGVTLTALGLTANQNRDDIRLINDWKIGKDIRDKQLTDDTDAIKKTLSRLMWIVLAGVIVAMLGLVLK